MSLDSVDLHIRRNFPGRCERDRYVSGLLTRVGSGNCSDGARHRISDPGSFTLRWRGPVVVFVFGLCSWFAAGSGGDQSGADLVEISVVGPPAPLALGPCRAPADRPAPGVHYRPGSGRAPS